MYKLRTLTYVFISFCLLLLIVVYACPNSEFISEYKETIFFIGLYLYGGVVFYLMFFSSEW